MRGGNSGAPMFVSVFLLPTQGVWFHASTDSDVVSLSDTNLYQRT